MAMTEKEKILKKKKKPSKKRKGSFFKLVYMGMFSIIIIILTIGFTSALVIYYNIADELPDVRKLKNF